MHNFERLPLHADGTSWKSWGRWTSRCCQAVQQVGSQLILDFFVFHLYLYLSFVYSRGCTIGWFLSLSDLGVPGIRSTGLMYVSINICWYPKNWLVRFKKPRFLVGIYISELQPLRSEGRRLGPQLQVALEFFVCFNSIFRLNRHKTKTFWRTCFSCECSGKSRGRWELFWRNHSAHQRQVNIEWNVSNSRFFTRYHFFI